MTQRFGFTSFLLIGALIFYSFYRLMPREAKPANAPKTEFSAHRAMAQLQNIAVKPHFHANAEHARVREYLVNELERMGMDVSVQSDVLLEQQEWVVKGKDSSYTAPGGYHLIRPLNIVGRLKGSGAGKALLLLSHYDSAKVPSPGASDAGSGIVTILESLDAYMASGEKPVNDIIVLFSDAEELGLFGAKTFAQKHPWANDLGLVLNFEARGSGGPSNMIVETNGGNAALIEAFAAASPPFPVASSLMYSVYKMLPNDTDSTIFREEGDIDSFFFAFIDDHFDYHTASDTIENLDIETLQHQGSYLLPLLQYFARADLSSLRSDEDQVYVNLPHLFVHYPFGWIFPMLLVAAVVFILLINYGFYLGRLQWKGIGRGMAALLLTVAACGLTGYLGWELLQAIYPRYNEIQHGFPYNGHSYIAFFVLLSVAISIAIYGRLGSKQDVTSMFVAPIFLWILINAAIAVYLKGAAYFIIPVYFALISLWILLRQSRPHLLLLVLLAAPAIFVFSPLIQFFPVGLGLKMVFISCVFTALLYGLLYSIVGFYRARKALSWLSLLAALFYFFQAHASSDFDAKNRKPNSLVYYLDKDEGKAYWATYDHILDSWTTKYLGREPRSAQNVLPTAAESKYNKGYRFAKEAPLEAVDRLIIRVDKDSVIDGNRQLDFTILPQGKLDELFIFSDSTQTYTSMSFNGLDATVSKGQVQTNSFSRRLLRMNMARGDSLAISLRSRELFTLHFDLITYSFDLMENPLFTISERGPDMMPKPFVNTDAVVVKQRISFPSPSGARSDQSDPKTASR